MTNEQTNQLLAALPAVLSQKLETYMTNESQEIHIHHHIHTEGRSKGDGHGDPRRGRGPGRGRSRGSRHASRRAVIRAFGAVRRGGSISADDFSDLQEVQRNLEQRLADLSDLIETIEREGLVDSGPQTKPEGPTEDSDA